MPREIRPPRPPPLPTSLPGEAAIDRALNRLAEKAAASPALRRLQDIHSRLPVLPELEVSTPMGTYWTPELAIPKPVIPEMGDRRREALKAAILDDISALVGFVPIVGDILSDPLEDIAMARIKDLLTSEEHARFVKKDKFWPLTAIAMIDSLSR